MKIQIFKYQKTIFKINYQNIYILYIKEYIDPKTIENINKTEELIELKDNTLDNSIVAQKIAENEIKDNIYN